MRQFLIIILLVSVTGCKDEDTFRPDVKYIYSPMWKIWEIRYFHPVAGNENFIIRTRDIEIRYIFTESIVYKSFDRGKNFIRYSTRHISLDSISFASLDSTESGSESYRVRSMFVSGDASPVEDSLRNERDALFPEIGGKLLFLQLENKKKTVIENQEYTEFLMLYN
ncbi:MAG TPA: hypothetical protein VI583_17575 [Cyclobacteriaceae bacterium]|nr:hypothetical protein [Cyclobacteriaceae bacterium]